MTVHIGLIGAGSVSQAHLPAYRTGDRVSLAAVCDADREARQEIASEFDVPVWGDFETFVEEADIDAVDITLPHNLHYPAARAALRAN
jgi:predicted dehydrogenase